MAVAVDRKTSTWFSVDPRRATGERRLICFPHAGGGPQTFSSWNVAVPRDYQVWIAELPGRGKRQQEKPIDNMQTLVEGLESALRPVLDDGVPFAFLGHCMGAWVAYELACRLRRADRTTPHLLYVAGMRSPNRRSRFGEMHQRTDEQLIEQLVRLGGTPQSVLDDTDYLHRLVLPTVRADFRVLETYRAELDPLDIPIFAMGGRDDQDTNAEELDGWAHYTSAGYASKWYPGSHFFLHTHTRELLPELLARFNSAVARREVTSWRS